MEKDWFAIFERKLLQIYLPKNTKVLGLKEIIQQESILKGFEQKRYDKKGLD